MKQFVIVLGGLGFLGLAVESAFGKSAESSSAPPPPPVHHAASAPATVPVGSTGVPHGYSGQPLSSGQRIGSGSYKPVTVYSNGQRVLVYPSVVGSAVGHHRSTNSTGNNAVHTSNTSEHATGSLHKSNGNISPKPGTFANSQHKPGGNITAKPRTLDAQTAARLRNWKGNPSSTAQALAKHADHCHHHHDHDWWRHHCVAFIFFDWGWWGWDDGWWYPAWGYDPYSYYEYNEPIYGDVSPEQIVAGVQAELQRRGYYSYAVDGKMGPLTRSALARYQTDHNMNITSGIDPATLNSLGIIR